MRAVPKPAILRQRLNIVETLLQLPRSRPRFRPKLHLAQPRQIHQQPSPRHHEQLPRSRRMPSPAIAGPHLRRALLLRPVQPVQNRRLAHPARPDQRRRLPRLEFTRQRVQPVVGQRTDRNHRQPRAHLPRLRHQVVQIQPQLPRQVGLVQQHHRPRPALICHHQKPLQPPRVIVAVKPAHNKQNIDVGRQHLLAHLALRLLAREFRPAFQHPLNHRPVRLQHHPVAHRRPQPATLAQHARHARIHFAVGRPHQKAPMVG